MKHNLVYTDDHMLVVNADEKIIPGDWIFMVESRLWKNTIAKCEALPLTEGWQKILAHRPLRENVSYLEGVDVLPDFGEVDVKKKAREFAMKPINPINPIGKITCLLSQNGYEKGYNQALEDNKEKKYTEEDVYKALSEAFMSFEEGYNITSKEIIQSILSSKRPVAFECEMKTDWDEGTIILMMSYGDNPSDFTFQPTVRTTINPEGRTEWVGKYV